MSFLIDFFFFIFKLECLIWVSLGQNCYIYWIVIDYDFVIQNGVQSYWGPLDQRTRP
jgi:hypothetical protein